jgi:P27 family predicted phage terminase small subunit
MGLRGPIPKPDALKHAEGNPGKRKLNRAELAEDPKAPPAPSYLDTEARKTWNRLVKLLLRKGVLREEDQITLANLCMTYSQLVHARRLLAEQRAAFNKLKRKTPFKDPLFVVAPSGYVQQSPLVSMINTYVDQVLKLSREFGLSPSSRARIRTNEDGWLPPGEATPEEQLEKILAD